MTPIEHAARECADHLWMELAPGNCTQEAFVNKYALWIQPHMVTLTKPLEDENKRLREALDWMMKEANRHDPVFPNRPVYFEAKALTKPT